MNAGLVVFGMVCLAVMFGRLYSFYWKRYQPYRHHPQFAQWTGEARSEFPAFLALALAFTVGATCLAAPLPSWSWSFAGTSLFACLATFLWVANERRFTRDDLERTNDILAALAEPPRRFIGWWYRKGLHAQYVNERWEGNVARSGQEIFLSGVVCRHISAEVPERKLGLTLLIMASGQTIPATFKQQATLIQRFFEDASQDCLDKGYGRDELRQRLLQAGRISLSYPYDCVVEIRNLEVISVTKFLSEPVIVETPPGKHPTWRPTFVN